MFLPLGTDRSLSRPTLMNYILVSVTVAAHIMTIAIDQTQGVDIRKALWVPGTWDPNKWYGLLTSVFMHGGMLHLAGNMLFLWVFGPNVEDRFGRFGYLVFYLFAGVIASATHMVASDNPAIGASGAVAGVTGAYLVLFPKTAIKCFVIFFFIGIFWIPAAWFILFAILRDFVMSGSNTGVAHAAHLGGYGCGIVLSLVLLWRRILDREPYDLFTIGKQWKRRRAFRDASRQYDGQAMRRVGTAVQRPDGQMNDEAAKARAEVGSFLSAGELDRASTAYKGLVQRFADQPSVITLNRNHQYALANAYYKAGDHDMSSLTYQLFLDAFPQDAEAPVIRLMLGLINARYLNDPIRAKQLLTEAIDGLRDDASIELARREIKELG